MPECQSCGSDVSKQFMRVFAADEDGDPETCPKCGLSIGRVEGVNDEDSSGGVDWTR